MGDFALTRAELRAPRIHGLIARLATNECEKCRLAYGRLAAARTAEPVALRMRSRSRTFRKFPRTN
jgi:hypothetical protein